MNRPDTLPQLLPWLAKQAGIDQKRAITLWRSAQRYATRQTGARNTGAYWQAAMSRFRTLLSQESLQMDIASLGIRSLVRNQSRWISAATESYERTSYLLRYWHQLPIQMFSASKRLTS